MRTLLNPKWLFLLNTLPIVILFFLFYSDFQIINTLLDEENILLWKKFGWSLFFLGLANFFYAIYLIINKKTISIWYAILALISYITFIYVYGFYSNQIIPFSIPDWMITGNLFLYVGTFLMPTLAFSLFILVTQITISKEDPKAWKSLMIAIFIPVTWYLFSQIILPLWQPVGENFSIHATLIFVIIGTLVFLFFLIQSALILFTKKADSWQKYELVWKIPIAVILPILGLLVNIGLFSSSFNHTDSGIFGDFNSPWYYILAILNGIFICLPNIENKLYRTFLFIGRSITLAFTFYFFLVFLPFLPLSVVAIIAVGVGFLMLSPLLLFILHLNELVKDFKYLKKKYSNRIIWSLSIGGFLIIPLFLLSSYYSDRNTLNETLEYVYSPDYSKKYKIDEKSLEKTLNVLKKHKDGNRGGIFGSQQPYLSSIFNWIVLDNLTLSYAKIDNLESIFFGKEPREYWSENTRNEQVKITDISSNSTYDKSQSAWKSWIDIEITNANTDAWMAEYATTIDLPEGTWISDYYLYVGDRKEMGILAEKRTAMWVFSSIRNENRDPGILYYLTGNKVGFRVFPFAKNEVRKTGIELLHKEPIQINIDDNVLNLGKLGVESIPNLKIKNDHAVYISALEKEKLKKINRIPYFHFIVNASKKENISAYKSQIEKISKKHSDLAENAKISFVNRYVTTTSINSNWKVKLENIEVEGGFYLDRALKTTLFNAYKSHEKTYPVIVVLSDDFENTVLDEDFSDWKFTFPESDVFYHLTKKLEFEPHSLVSNPRETVKDSTNISFDNPVLEYILKDNSIRYIPDNKKSSILLKTDQFESNAKEMQENNWNSALTMQAMWRSQILHPETTNTEWLNLVKHSFVSKVMSPVTSFLVVENEAQKAILKKKQEEVLASNKSLDVGDDTRRMSEPSWFVLAFLLGIIIYYRKRRQVRMSEK